MNGCLDWPKRCYWVDAAEKVPACASSNMSARRSGILANSQCVSILFSSEPGKQTDLKLRGDARLISVMAFRGPAFAIFYVAVNASSTLGSACF